MDARALQELMRLVETFDRSEIEAPLVFEPCLFGIAIDLGACFEIRLIGRPIGHILRRAYVWDARLGRLRIARSHRKRQQNDAVPAHRQ